MEVLHGDAERLLGVDLGFLGRNRPQGRCTASWRSKSAGLSSQSPRAPRKRLRGGPRPRLLGVGRIAFAKLVERDGASLQRVDWHKVVARSQQRRGVVGVGRPNSQHSGHRRAGRRRHGGRLWRLAATRAESHHLGRSPFGAFSVAHRHRLDKRVHGGAPAESEASRMT